MVTFKINSMFGERILITGGLGFIGSNLAVKCVELGAEVTIFARSLKDLKNIAEIKGRVKVVEGDITKYSDVEDTIKDQKMIFHLAAQTSNITSMEKPFLDIDINLIGTMNILESCRRYNPSAKIIATGTCTQLGKAIKLPIDENLKDDPLSVYEADKLTCEKYLQIYHRAYGLHTTLLRLANVFGERQKLNNPRNGITNFFIGKILKNEEITVYGDGQFIRDYNYVGNVVDALILAAQNKNSDGEVFLVGSNKKIFFVDMVKEVITTVEEVVHKKGKFNFAEFPKGHSQIDVGDTLVDYKKINEKLGWEPRVSFKEGLVRTVLFYKDRYQEYL